MQIDRTNYEIWLIDWLDGHLNSYQVEQLKLFLDQNSDLREEFNDSAPVNFLSSGISFPHKEDLRKSPSDISLSQFEYLCTAYLENDLTDDQQVELLEIVDRYPDRKKTFDLIQITKIPQKNTDYKHKSLLLKRTALQKVIRLSVIGISAAAAISLMIIAFSAIHETSTLKPYSSAHNLISDSTFRKPSSVKATGRISTDNIPGSSEKESEYRSVNNNKKENAAADYNKNTIAPPVDSFLRKTDDLRMSLNKVPVYSQVDLAKGIVIDTLVASSPTFMIPDAEDERSKVGKFISKTFREKILREKTPTDSPLKGFEIAEAGVAGLNKLFGWQMVLDTKNDVDGQPRSVYFSSNILKVNAPVKKNETQP